MRIPSKETVEDLRRQYPVGCRVVLDCMDDIGSILVRWDNGCGLSVVYGVDRCHKIK